MPNFDPSVPAFPNIKNKGSASQSKGGLKDPVVPKEPTIPSYGGAFGGHANAFGGAVHDAHSVYDASVEHVSHEAVPVTQTYHEPAHETPATQEHPVVEAHHEEPAAPGPLDAITQKVFFDLQLDGQDAGRVVFGLYGNAVPDTVKNFATLAQGTAGATADGVPLSYKGSTFHRVIPGFMAQGGDFTRGDGTGGESIYGAKFNDENFLLEHSKPYQLAMANSGPNTNGSQFYITFDPMPHLDGKHVVFGEVVDGIQAVEAMSAVGSRAGATSKTVTIADCGVL